MNEASETTVTLKSWLVLFFLSLVWGTSYILIKKGLIAFSPYQLAALRLTVSALAFVPFLIWKFKEIDWSKWQALFLVGLTGTALPSFLFPLAQTQISSSIAGMLKTLSEVSEGSLSDCDEVGFFPLASFPLIGEGSPKNFLVTFLISARENGFVK